MAVGPGLDKGIHLRRHLGRGHDAVTELVARAGDDAAIDDPLRYSRWMCFGVLTATLAREFAAVSR